MNSFAIARGKILSHSNVANRFGVRFPSHDNAFSS